MSELFGKSEQLKTCPRCGTVNTDDWPLDEGDGGCQECWEAECSRKWWVACEQAEAMREPEAG